MSEERLAELTVEDFASRIGDTFEVAEGEDAIASAQLRLMEARPLGPGRSGWRAPFSLLFEGPAAELLQQQTLWFSNADFGTLPIFIVPIESSGQTVTYEAVFS